jgi:tmRNA-binding protein
MYLRLVNELIEDLNKRGKQQHDKREDLKKRDAEREIARALNKR